MDDATATELARSAYSSILAVIYALMPVPDEFRTNSGLASVLEKMPSELSVVWRNGDKTVAHSIGDADIEIQASDLTPDFPLSMEVVYLNPVASTNPNTLALTSTSQQLVVGEKTTGINVTRLAALSQIMITPGTPSEHKTRARALEKRLTERPAESLLPSLKTYKVPDDLQAASDGWHILFHSNAKLLDDLVAQPRSFQSAIYNLLEPNLRNGDKGRPAFPLVLDENVTRPSMNSMPDIITSIVAELFDLPRRIRDFPASSPAATPFRTAYEEILKHSVPVDKRGDYFAEFNEAFVQSLKEEFLNSISYVEATKFPLAQNFLRLLSDEPLVVTKQVPSSSLLPSFTFGWSRRPEPVRDLYTFTSSKQTGGLWSRGPKTPFEQSRWYYEMSLLPDFTIFKAMMFKSAQTQAWFASVASLASLILLTLREGERIRIAQPWTQQNFVTRLRQRLQTGFVVLPDLRAHDSVSPQKVTDEFVLRYSSLAAIRNGARWLDKIRPLTTQANSAFTAYLEHQQSSGVVFGSSDDLRVSLKQIDAFAAAANELFGIFNTIAEPEFRTWLARQLIGQSRYLRRDLKASSPSSAKRRLKRQRRATLKNLMTQLKGFVPQVAGESDEADEEEEDEESREEVEDPMAVEDMTALVVMALADIPTAREPLPEVASAAAVTPPSPRSSPPPILPSPPVEVSVALVPLPQTPVESTVEKPVDETELMAIETGDEETLTVPTVVERLPMGPPPTAFPSTVIPALVVPEEPVPTLAASAADVPVVTEEPPPETLIQPIPGPPPIETIPAPELNPPWEPRPNLEIAEPIKRRKRARTIGESDESEAEEKEEMAPPEPKRIATEERVLVQKELAPNLILEPSLVLSAPPPIAVPANVTVPMAEPTQPEEPTAPLPLTAPAPVLIQPEPTPSIPSTVEEEPVESEAKSDVMDTSDVEPVVAPESPVPTPVPPESKGPSRQIFIAVRDIDAELVPWSDDEEEKEGGEEEGKEEGGGGGGGEGEEEEGEEEDQLAKYDQMVDVSEGIATTAPVNPPSAPQVRPSATPAKPRTSASAPATSALPQAAAERKESTDLSLPYAGFGTGYGQILTVTGDMITEYASTTVPSPQLAYLAFLRNLQAEEPAAPLVPFELTEELKEWFLELDDDALQAMKEDSLATFPSLDSDSNLNRRERFDEATRHYKLLRSLVQWRNEAQIDGDVVLFSNWHGDQSMANFYTYQFAVLGGHVNPQKATEDASPLAVFSVYQSRAEVAEYWEQNPGETFAVPGTTRKTYHALFPVFVSRLLFLIWQLEHHPDANKKVNFRTAALPAILTPRGRSDELERIRIQDDLFEIVYDSVIEPTAAFEARLEQARVPKNDRTSLPTLTSLRALHASIVYKKGIANPTSPNKEPFVHQLKARLDVRLGAAGANTTTVTTSPFSAVVRLPDHTLSQEALNAVEWELNAAVAEIEAALTDQAIYAGVDKFTETLNKLYDQDMTNFVGALTASRNEFYDEDDDFAVPDETDAQLAVAGQLYADISLNVPASVLRAYFLYLLEIPEQIKRLNRNQKENENRKKRKLRQAVRGDDEAVEEAVQSEDFTLPVDLLQVGPIFDLADFDDWTTADALQMIQERFSETRRIPGTKPPLFLLVPVTLHRNPIRLLAFSFTSTKSAKYTQTTWYSLIQFNFAAGDGVDEGPDVHAPAVDQIAVASLNALNHSRLEGRIVNPIDTTVEVLDSYRTIFTVALAGVEGLLATAILLRILLANTTNYAINKRIFDYNTGRFNEALRTWFAAQFGANRNGSTDLTKYYPRERTSFVCFLYYILDNGRDVRATLDSNEKGYLEDVSKAYAMQRKELIKEVTERAAKPPKEKAAAEGEGKPESKKPPKVTVYYPVLAARSSPSFTKTALTLIEQNKWTAAQVDGSAKYAYPPAGPFRGFTQTDWNAAFLPDVPKDKILTQNSFGGLFNYPIFDNAVQTLFWEARLTGDNATAIDGTTRTICFPVATLIKFQKMAEEAGVAPDDPDAALVTANKSFTAFRSNRDVFVKEVQKVEEIYVQSATDRSHFVPTRTASDHITTPLDVRQYDTAIFPAYVAFRDTKKSMYRAMVLFVAQGVAEHVAEPDAKPLRITILDPALPERYAKALVPINGRLYGRQIRPSTSNQEYWTATSRYISDYLLLSRAIHMWKKDKRKGIVLPPKSIRPELTYVNLPERLLRKDGIYPFAAPQQPISTDLPSSVDLQSDGTKALRDYRDRYALRMSSYRVDFSACWCLALLQTLFADKISSQKESIERLLGSLRIPEVEVGSAAGLEQFETEVRQRVRVLTGSNGNPAEEMFDWIKDIFDLVIAELVDYEAIGQGAEAAALRAKWQTEVAAGEDTDLQYPVLATRTLNLARGEGKGSLSLYLEVLAQLLNKPRKPKPANKAPKKPKAITSLVETPATLSAVEGTETGKEEQGGGEEEEDEGEEGGGGEEENEDDEMNVGEEGGGEPPAV